uniref:AP complex mu/sigma subunit domain-containing protein n=1 Tax=Chaetoceros debilis TaxID=122233 RepID=A0A7S3VES1_9STRA|mmetsp:Transcript_3036/g.4472  ORF Transcript_3036/g.4472 Transcript_3036/m.4472 type:complete len:195 (+) Transcript_3036:119-703(+)|eukprot:CAMPEP_0194083162 /NCGR_PEP_ID=MMETSP0149-20130528/8483_1 /TAXON_ID=122233 /ORGANISM="Chaetoceros debilis, Strain MM31A-1" /LENGTH=194 /DNA_ID=CAMNT_0038765503 /DNA_START=81 /DNA_END=665 /DNA_ORIENTATION=-
MSNNATNRSTSIGWHFIILMSRQGKIRLSEFFSPYTESEKRRILRDISSDILPRQPKMCNIIEKGEYKFVYRRYASLYFIVGVPIHSNELLVLEEIHLFVEALDGYFNSVCELDLVFSLHKSLSILFEMFVGGMLTETNKREVLKNIIDAEGLVEEMSKAGEDVGAQLDDGLSYQEQFQLGRKPGRRGDRNNAR